MRDDRERLLDMLDAIERIEHHTSRGREVFEENELIQTWVVHHLEIIGEAASKLCQGVRDTYNDVPWPQIIAMRNVIAHEYFGIDLDTVWEVVDRDLPELKQKLNKVYRDLCSQGTDD